MKITRQLAKELKADIDVALESVAQKYDVSISMGSGSYSDHNFTLRLEITSRGEDGVMLSLEAQAFKRQAYVFGLKPEDLGREFEVAGQSYRISGCKPKSPKFPILAIRGDGRVYKFGAERVREALA